MTLQRSFWALGLRARVLLPTLLICLFAITIGVFVVDRTSERSYHDLVLHRAESISHSIGHLAGEAKLDLLQKFVSLMGKERDVKLVVVAAGEPLKVIACSKQEWVDRNTLELPDSEHIHADLARVLRSNQLSFEFDHDASGCIDFTLPMAILTDNADSGNWTKGAVMLHLDGQPLTIEQTRIRKQVLAALIIAVGLAVLGVYGMFQIVVLTPIDRIAKTASSVASGERNARVNCTQENELGELATNIDAMLDHLIQSEMREANSTEELKISRERYELAINGSSDGLWDWNISSGTIFYSPRVKGMLGYEDHEFANDIKTLWAHVQSNERLLIKVAVRKHLLNNQPFDVSCRIRTKNYEYRWFRIKGAAIRDQQGIANRMAGSISDITAIKAAQEQLVRNGLIDSLTGLPNRTLLLERLQSSIENCQTANQPYALLFLDLDRFKLINDSLGHHAGDDFLRQIARRLCKQCQSVDSIHSVVQGNTCARIGGDEFVVLIQDLAGEAEAQAIADELCKILSSPYQLVGQQVHSSASIGIVFGTARYTLASDVLRDADTAMYEAKRLGKARFVLFDEKMRESVIRRQQLENDLYRAVGAGELELEYQPIVDIPTRSVRSLEVLCRWKHPNLGSISPVEFIPIAEETGQINDLFAWVFRTACRQLSVWKKELGDVAPRTLSVNVSRKQFASQELCSFVRSTLAEFAIDASLIELEVTEDAFCEDLPRAVQILQELKEIGVRLAIDDFGIGSSSFASLHRFPVDSIKIDRSLTNDVAHSIEAKALFEGMIVIARGLGISLVAEGVEVQDQLDVLADFGCDLAQGYFFSRPIPAQKVAKFLGEHQLQEV
jgi:diguanylate cyclase (GGDEF)-like protein/PAS domain S-box-containing protein